MTLSARLRSFLALVLSFLLVSGVLAAPASAATYTLKASGSGTITTAQSKVLSVTYLRDGRAVGGASVTLQRKSGSSWVTAATVKTGPRGKASARVAPDTTQVYRFRTTSATSASLKVTVVPASFVLAGSGSGHGVGMSQWGAYKMARDGKTVHQILGYYYRNATPSTATRADDSLQNDDVATIRVQVLGPPADSRTTTTLSIGSGSWRILDATGAQVATGASGQPVTIGVTTTGVKASFVSGSSTVTKSGTKLYFEWSGTRYFNSSGTASIASVAGAQGTYRHGRFEITKISSRPNVVNQVVLNTEYLYGIEEMPSGWGTTTNRGAAALQAQAIVARNYAITEKVKGLKSACGCHVYDDTRSQNYTGWRKQGGSYGSTWAAAVDETVQETTVSVVRGTASNAIVETPFFASSGKGTTTLKGTANNRDVFGTTQLSHLVHVADSWSLAAPGNPYVSWTDSITQAKARSIFGMTQVKSISVTARYSSGQVKSLTATSPTGTKVVRTKTAESWRTALGLTGVWVGSIKGK